MARPIKKEHKYTHSLDKDLGIEEQRKKESSSNKQHSIFGSIDDIEVIRRRNLERIISQETVKSKDDLYIIDQERVHKLISRGINVLKNQEQLPNTIYESKYKEPTHSRTYNIINSIKTSKIWGNIKKISNVAEKIIFNKTTASVLGLIASSIMLATIAPAAAPFMFVSAAAMATSIVGKAIVDVVHTRKIRLLTQENKLLVKHRDDLSKQQALLKIDPKLKDDLYIHNNPPQTKGKSNRGSKSLLIASVITNGVSNIVNVAGISAAVLGGGIAQIISSINIGLQSLKGSKKSVNQIQDKIKLIKELNRNINQEKQKTDLGNYKNIQALAEIGYKQTIQTEALTALLQDKNYFRFTDQEKQRRFNQLSKEITLTTAQEYADTKKITSQNIIIDVLKDIGRAHSPFYKQPEQIDSYKSILTKAVESANTKDHKEDQAIPLKKKLELSDAENITNRIRKQLINNNTIPNNAGTPGSYIKRIAKKDLGLIR